MVNARDDQAESALKTQCRGEALYLQPHQSGYDGRASLATATITQHQHIKGWWAAWDSIAQEIVAAEKAQGKHIPIATTDVGPVPPSRWLRGT